MANDRKYGYFRPFVPNNRADMRRVKQYCRNREYTTKHEEVMAAKREAQQLREMEEMKRDC